MYIHKRLGLKTCYRLVITILAILGVGIEFFTINTAAWRTFATWSLLLTAIYFLISSIKTAFYIEENESQPFCPMWQGLVIVSNLTVLIAQMLATIWQVTIPGLVHGEVFLIAILLPILVLCDWLLMSPKGNWRPSYPFYWLTFPVIYAAWILITAEFAPSRLQLAYPYYFLNPAAIGLDCVVWSLVVVFVLILAAGYTLFVLDFIMSGQVRRHIVLPRIKTIIIEEQIDTPVLDEADFTTEAQTVANELEREDGATSSAETATKSEDELNPESEPETKAQSKSKARSAAQAKPSNNSVASQPNDKAKPKAKPQSKRPTKVQITTQPNPTNLEQSKDQKSAQNIHKHQQTTAQSNRARSKTRLKNYQAPKTQKSSK